MCAAENILESASCLLSEKQLESVYYLSSEDFRPLPQVTLRPCHGLNIEIR